MVLQWVLLIVICVFAALLVALLAPGVRIWLKARLNGLRVGLGHILCAQRQRLPIEAMVDAAIEASRAGLNVSVERIEAHAKAGGRFGPVIRALIAAGAAGIELTFDHACTMDLAGRDVRRVVDEAITPVVLACPDPAGGADTVRAVTLDGVTFHARAKVTARASIERAIGGAGAGTLRALVSEGLATAIASVEDHKKLLENPDQISAKVAAMGIDSTTAYDILSINTMLEF